MKKIGVVLVVLGLASLVLTGIAVNSRQGMKSVATEGVLTNETTFDEEIYFEEHCIEYYTAYDEYGEYTECNMYRTFQYFNCNANIVFSYTTVPDSSGEQENYTGTTSQAIFGSTVSCLESIKEVFQVNDTIDVYYWEHAPEEYSIREQGVDYIGQFCSALCGLLFIFMGIGAALISSNEKTKLVTGGLSHRKKLKTAETKAPQSSSFQTLPSQQDTLESSRKNKKEASSFWSSQGIAPSNVCGHITCTRKVNQYHFKCSTCAKSFCSLHSGKTMQCQQCEA